MPRPPPSRRSRAKHRVPMRPSTPAPTCNPPRFRLAMPVVIARRATKSPAAVMSFSAFVKFGWPSRDPGEAEHNKRNSSFLPSLLAHFGRLPPISTGLVKWPVPNIFYPIVFEGATMPSPRPGSVTAAGVLSIIYGSLFTLCGMCAVGGMLGQEAMGKNFFGGNDPVQMQVQNEWEQALQRDVPTYQAFQIGTNLVNLALAVSLLIAGIGLLSMNPWARTLAMTASLLAILAYIF